MTELLRLVSQAQGTLEMQRASEGAEMKSWWGWLTGVLSGTEEEGADARKSLLHLRSASSDLCQLFKVGGSWWPLHRIFASSHSTTLGVEDSSTINLFAA